jgi:RNA polymerase sigma-70 factor (ECF subfamily)
MNSLHYREAIDRYSDGLYRFALRMCRDRDSANDLVQEAFTRLWERKEHVDREKCKSYLFTSVYRLFLDHKKKQDRLTLPGTLEPQRTSSGQLSPDLQKILHQALERLPEIQKTLVLLRDYEGYSYDEIGEITSLNASQVKVYIYRARVALKEFIVSPDNVL